MYDDFGKASAEVVQCNPTTLSNVKLKDSLGHQLKKAEAEVKRLTELLALLEENAQTERILELLGGRVY